jgi:mRNA interferase RelE/StbE
MACATGSRVLVRRSAEKEIGRLPVGVRRLVVQRIVGLREDPRPPGKLSGGEGHRIRQGDYRVVYTVDDGQRTVTVVRAAHRSDVYR